MIITIDGPSGTGKSSVAKIIAQKLHFTYVDTGAMFRSYAYGLLIHSIDLEDHSAVIAFIRSTPLHIRGDALEKQFFLADLEVTAHLRRQNVAEAASKISTLAEVRKVLKEKQRDLGQSQDTIFCGRDMGSVIFPDADLKIYLTASARIRAERRLKELRSLGMESDLDTIEREINDRDTRDQTRAIAPLRPAFDAHIIDTTSMTIPEVVDTILSLWKLENAH